MVFIVFVSVLTKCIIYLNPIIIYLFDLLAYLFQSATTCHWVQAHTLQRVFPLPECSCLEHHTRRAIPTLIRNTCHCTLVYILFKETQFKNKIFIIGNLTIVIVDFQVQCLKQVWENIIDTTLLHILNYISIITHP